MARNFRASGARPCIEHNVSKISHRGQMVGEDLIFPENNAEESTPTKTVDSDSAGSTDHLPVTSSTSTPHTSRVLLLRELSQNATEEDIQQVIHPFNQGIMAKICVRATTGHAFVEFQDENCCVAALNYLKQNSVVVKGMVLKATLSKRDHVTTSGSGSKMEPTKVVLVSINKLVYPVNLETLYALMSQCGTVEKIVCFSKTPMVFQALVQYRDASEVKRAMSSLHNRNMYNGGNRFQLAPSRHTELNVTSNDKLKSWDFTTKASLSDQFSEIGDGRGYIPLSALNPSLLQQTCCDGPGSGFAVRHQPVFQPPMALAAPCMPQVFPPMTQSDACHGIRNPNTLLQSSAQTYDPLMTAVIPTGLPQTPVIICYNIVHDQMNVQKLFNLFSLYGCVTRVKVLKDKPDTALVQYSHYQYALLARSCLHEVAVYGRQLQIGSSKNWEIKMPLRHEGEEDDAPKRTVEFSRRDQRHKEESDKYMRSACKPTSTLFIANIDDNVKEEDLVELLSTIAKPRTVTIKKGSPMSSKNYAIVAMPSQPDAIDAVCSLHDYDLCSSRLKIAFSKMVLQ